MEPLQLVSPIFADRRAPRAHAAFIHRLVHGLADALAVLQGVVLPLEAQPRRGAGGVDLELLPRVLAPRANVYEPAEARKAGF